MRPGDSYDADRARLPRRGSRFRETARLRRDAGISIARPLPRGHRIATFDHDSESRNIYDDCHGESRGDTALANDLHRRDANSGVGGVEESRIDLSQIDLRAT